ncbi:sensor histidine kinase [Pseudogemmobacter bohemicus]|uniref:sensor histidine kinase n=1 Tax=Pseudogemmobacter bohemicus TaxID=2250708 RepID=UPI000DD3F32C|nr:HAMP domain-containing sensor histidine kinase [Pseudogemmobacter bohemicus]
MDEGYSTRANRRTLALLVRLRWLAMAGQALTIAMLHFGFDLRLPLLPMAAVLAAQSLLNIACQARARRGAPVTERGILALLLLDVLALAVQLGLSGGTTNPFISLFLLHIILGAMLSGPRAAWVLTGFSALAWMVLSRVNLALELPHDHGAAPGGDFLDLHLWGMFICFLLAAGLMVWAITQIRDTLAERDAALAALRLQRSEEDHLVHIGLLASGAAHELGSPLATISVILGDWAQEPAIRQSPELGADLADVTTQLARCKSIITGVLASSGAARSEGATRGDPAVFFDQALRDWRAHHPGPGLDFRNDLAPGQEAILDLSLRQALFNLLENAETAGPGTVALHIFREGDLVTLRVTDRGPGFAPEILAAPAQPWNSTSMREGAVLGLFLCHNVARRFGGSLSLRNLSSGGAEAVMRLSLWPIAGDL